MEQQTAARRQLVHPAGGLLPHHRLVLLAVHVLAVADVDCRTTATL